MVNPDIATPEASDNTVSIEAFVYVITAGNDAVKVGVARDALNRLKGLQTGHYRRRSIAHQTGFIAEQEAYAIERRAHRLLEAKQIEGEWFAVSPQEAQAAIEQAINDLREEQRLADEAGTNAARKAEESEHAYLGPEMTVAEPWIRSTMDVMRFVLSQEHGPEKQYLINFGDCVVFVSCTKNEEAAEWHFFLNDVSRWHMREEDGKPYDCDKPSSSPLGNPPCALFATVFEPYGVAP